MCIYVLFMVMFLEMITHWVHNRYDILFVNNNYIIFLSREYHLSLLKHEPRFAINTHLCAC